MRHAISTSTIAILFAALGSGCTGVGTKTFESFDINKGTSVSIDATQRVILVKQTKDGRLVCAEPSPDAVVAASAQVAAKAQVSEAGSGELSGAVSQVASSIGIRTSTIQLLRDGYFRACEASLNGMLDPDAYQRILAGITPVMVGLVAIDGLVQMEPAPIVTVGAAPGDKMTDGTTTPTVQYVTMNVDRANSPGVATSTEIADRVVKIVELVLENQNDSPPQDKKEDKQ